MTIEEAKEIAITETDGYWEIGDTFENKTILSALKVEAKCV